MLPLECYNGNRPPDLAFIAQGLFWVEREREALCIMVAIRVLDDLACAHRSGAAYR
jgi:hypothetical protein